MFINSGLIILLNWKGKGSTDCQAFLFSANGVSHQTSVPYTYQQKGVVEKKHKYLLEVSRELLFQSKIPLKYWVNMFNCDLFVNMISSTILLNISPFEKFHGHLPSYAHLKSFSSLSYASSPKVGRNNFHSSLIVDIFLGYPCGKNGYKLLS